MKEIKRQIKEIVTYQYDNFEEWQKHEETLKLGGWTFESTSANPERSVTYSRKVSE